MPTWRAFLVLVLSASTGFGAELQTLKGKVITGDLVRIDDKDIVLKVGDTETVTPVAETLNLNFGQEAKPPTGINYQLVELNDGTKLHSRTFRLVNKEATLELLSGQVLKLPLDAIGNVLNDAQEEENRKEWRDRLKKKRRRDMLVRVTEGVVAGLEGTLGTGDETGETIEFTVILGEQKLSKRFKLDSLRGLIFTRGVDPGAAPVICRVVDTEGNEILASAITSGEAGLQITTPSGAKFSFQPEQLSLLDYSKGKITYLSDLDPSDRVSKTAFGEFPARRDKNISGETMKLGGTPYRRGWSLRAHTELEFELNSEYREFRTIAGIDDSRNKLYEDKQPVILRILGDGKELYRREFTPTQKDRLNPIVLNITNVEKLRLIVTTTELSLYPAGKNLDLASARVMK
jgi:hypothetical protein